MIRNFLISAFRNFGKNKLLTIINVLGLSTGITVCLVIYQYISYELSFDKFNINHEVLYRIERDPFCTIAPSFIPLLENDFPEIDHITRMTAGWDGFVKYNNRSFKEDNICFAEPNIFNALTFDLIAGEPDHVLDEGNVVITESIARKYFGTDNPLGKTLLFWNEYPFTVTGIIKDYPENAHLRCDLLCSYLSLRDNDVALEDDYFLGNNNFSDNVALAYIKFHAGTNISEFESKLPSFINRHIPSNIGNDGQETPASNNIRFTLRKVEDIHLHSHKINEIKTNSDIKYIYIFSSLAILIIIIACINFFNLSTATIDKRLKETGIKKILGIKKKNIYFQSFIESLLLILFSTGLALILNLYILPFLKSFLEIGNDVQLCNPLSLGIWLSIIIVVLSFITGIVPGSYFALGKPIDILKMKSSKATRHLQYRNMLVVFQFVVAIGLFVSVGIIFKQMKYIQNKELGFEKNNILIIPAYNEVTENWNTVQQELLDNSNIIDVALSKRTIGSRLLDAPGLNININDNWISWPRSIPHIRTGFNYFKTYHIPIIAGRDFNPEIANDSTKAFILNETAVKLIGIKNPQEIIGKQIRAGRTQGAVIGVVRDFNYESLHSRIIPMVTYLDFDECNTLSVRINQSNSNSTIDYVKRTLAEYYTDYEFTYNFLDDRLTDLYKNEQKMMTLIVYAAVFSIFIAGIGLLGLSLFISERRIKEIGIRKVNGANILEIISLLNKDFVKWIIIAFIIAIPISWYSMHKWLENFAFKTNMSWWVFILAGIMAMAIAIITVSWQSWKAATRNPVEALRYE